MWRLDGHHAQFARSFGCGRFQCPKNRFLLVVFLDTTEAFLDVVLTLVKVLHTIVQNGVITAKAEDWGQLENSRAQGNSMDKWNNLVNSMRGWKLQQMWCERRCGTQWSNMFFRNGRTLTFAWTDTKFGTFREAIGVALAGTDGYRTKVFKCHHIHKKQAPAKNYFDFFEEINEWVDGGCAKEEKSWLLFSLPGRPAYHTKFFSVWLSCRPPQEHLKKRYPWQRGKREKSRRLGGHSSGAHLSNNRRQEIVLQLSCNSIVHKSPTEGTNF